MTIRVAGIRKNSIVDGPGIRLSIYFQGCSHCCPGCHNPETWDPCRGSEVSVAQMVTLVENSSGIDGVTLSGGEPFEQAESAALLAAEIIKRGFNLVIFSGYYFEDLYKKSNQEKAVSTLLRLGWLLVDGPFIERERDLTLAFRGSRNQRLIDLPLSLAKAAPVLYKS